MKPATAIRTRLLLLLIVPTVVLWAAAITSTFYTSIHLTRIAYDDDLQDSVRTLASRIRFENNRPGLALSEESIALITRESLDTIWYRIIDREGRLVSGDAASFPLPPPARQVQIHDGIVHGELSRIATMYIAGHEPGEQAIVQVAQTLAVQHQASRKSIERLLPPMMLLLVLASACVWFGVGRGLRPLGRIKSQLEERSASDLTPLPTAGLERELRPLVDALNGLLLRVHTSVETQRGFVTNAAHQLRTPLAGLKNQIEIAQRHASDPRQREELTALESAVDRLIHLAKKLLALARAERGTGNVQGWRTVDLVNLVREATSDLVAHALERSLDIEFYPDEQSIQFFCDPENVRELVGNLIENAVNYSSPGGKISVRLANEAEGIVIEVDDTGPGIPAEERTKIFGRFYRIPGTTAPGTGLGLAIVNEIANEHGGSITVEDGSSGSGTKMIVRLPRHVERRSSTPPPRAAASA